MAGGFLGIIWTDNTIVVHASRGSASPQNLLLPHQRRSPIPSHLQSPLEKMATEAVKLLETTMSNFNTVKQCNEALIHVIKGGLDGMGIAMAQKLDEIQGLVTGHAQADIILHKLSDVQSTLAAFVEKCSQRSEASAPVGFAFGGQKREVYSKGRRETSFEEDGDDSDGNNSCDNSSSSDDETASVSSCIDKQDQLEKKLLGKPQSEFLAGGAPATPRSMISDNSSYDSADSDNLSIPETLIGDSDVGSDADSDE